MSNWSDQSAHSLSCPEKLSGIKTGRDDITATRPGVGAFITSGSGTVRNGVPGALVFRPTGNCAVPLLDTVPELLVVVVTVEVLVMVVAVVSWL